MPAADRSECMEARAFYQRAMRALQAAGIPFLVGGAYALQHYTGIVRRTKDCDIFMRRSHVGQALRVLTAAGYRTEITFSYWLAKAFDPDTEDLLDIVFSSANGLAPVDEAWFAHATPGTALDVPVRFMPAEEMIWQKAFIMERERYDGADVAHLLRGCATKLDWPRLLERFGEHWPVLLSHLMLFRYIYPGHQALVPRSLLDELLRRALSSNGAGSANARLCRGPLLSLLQFQDDIDILGYRDARLTPNGNLTAEERDHLTSVFTGPAR